MRPIIKSHYAESLRCSCMRCWRDRPSRAQHSKFHFIDEAAIAPHDLHIKTGGPSSARDNVCNANPAGRRVDTLRAGTDPCPMQEKQQNEQSGRARWIGVQPALFAAGWAGGRARGATGGARRHAGAARCCDVHVAASRAGGEVVPAICTEDGDTGRSRRDGALSHPSSPSGRRNPEAGAKELCR
jgi:hypothetical protein